MGISIAGLLILGVFLTAVLLLGRSATISSTVVATSAKDAIDRSGERARTMFRIENTTVSGAGADLTVQVENIGAMSISDFPHMDLIVKYTHPVTGSPPVIGFLPYTEGGLGNNQWTVNSITPDGFEPGVWNPGESMTLGVKLDPPQKTSTTGTLAVASPNGVSATAYFP